MPNALTAEELDARVRRAVFNDWLGLRLKELDEDSITLELPWRPEIVSNPAGNYLHGGVIAAVVDAAAFFALEAKLGRGSPTADLQVDFLRSAPQGALQAQGRVVKLGSRLSVAESRVWREDGKLVAVGRGAFLTSPPPDEA